MRLGFILVDDIGAPYSLQLASMAAGGVEDLDGDAPRLYVERMVGAGVTPSLLERDQLIADLRPGDVVVVHSMDRLGRSAKDLLAVLKAVGSKGASVFDVQASELVSCSPESIRSIDAYLRGERGLVDLHTAMMRRQKAALGDVAKGGGKPRWTKAELEAARPAWFDRTKTEAEAVAIAKIPGRTLLRYFGKRGRPLFGREQSAQKPKPRHGSRQRKDEGK